MKLYFSPGVCSQAPHIVLRETGLPFELVKVDTAAKRTEDGADYLQVNPNGYVPALEIEPGVVLTEGPAIMQYIADRAPQTGLAPAAGTLERYRLQSWLNFITSELHKGFSPLFHPQTPEAYKAQAIEMLGRRFDTVERHLAGTPYLMGERFGIADAYLFVVAGWSGYVGIDLGRWPNLAAFRQRVAQRPAVKAALAAESAAQSAKAKTA
ncbi:glutathione S-transferase domain-containing protein [Mizugakiibacter sediminis]|uniref:Glutathione S-transferase n=1 Tax=Mizugakiibacter sediminis TaxID=1475481 RepID=A0A0K8QLU0_9GAMM|nr:glutathione transferase GstA [Mizugakiibacter sediminis]GAP65407.1 glutathione S-transferase domain-containing protein [Mizugakiibacter sediminis]